MRGFGIMKVSIRPAQLSDCKGLAHLQVDSYRSAYAGILPEAYLKQFGYAEQEQDWHEWITEKPADLLLVAEKVSGMLVGYVLGRVKPTTLPPYDGEVAALHVGAAYQRQGIGRVLFVEAARLLKAMGCKSLLVWVLEDNHPAVNFYERMGGKRIGRQVIDLGENAVHPTEVAYGWLDVASLWA